MDLIGPSRYGDNSYIFIIVDDYFRFTWTLFLKYKSDTFKAFKKLANMLQNQKGYIIMSLSHRGDFENKWLYLILWEKWDKS